MFRIKESTPLEYLTTYREQLNGELYENNGVHTLQINNEHADGYIRSYTIFKGFQVRIYDLMFKEDFQFVLEHTPKASYYFSYVVKGHYFHRFLSETLLSIVDKNKSTIFLTAPTDESEIIFPKEEKLNICTLIFDYDQIKKSGSDTDRKLVNYVAQALAKITYEESYRYLGPIDLKTLTQAEAIIRNDSGTIGRIMNEGSVLKMFASQVNSYIRNLGGKKSFTGLTDIELSKIATIKDYIRAHIDQKISVESLSSSTGINPKKLQIGTKFLFNTSVNLLITHLRFSYAKELIETTDMTMSEICYKIGLSNRSYFSKKFVEQYGILPNQYKNALQNNTTLFELSYESEVVPTVTQKDINDIIQTSIITNNQLNITGCLVYFDNKFLQLLEGPKVEVLALYQRMKKDHRHSNVETLWKGIKLNRHFNEWNMAFARSNDEYMVNLDGRTEKLSFIKTLDEFKQTDVATEESRDKIRNMVLAAI
ncbi:BLUF domain-containing protein [Aquimarina sp. ERC-38]|uniref:BLUF domain-containing protein n=1 Tax=Aquimarina sp. ERC-38 TaxID=2949996 RepID=UPI00224508E0|nr:BLUF domain-containing protein [Aquimarina sp. ERC-38]UZO82333.1 BLUF domain-containing protein [Aquimarina sp. ERC-38]